AAVRHPVTPQLLRQQFGRLGGSVYTLRALEADIQGRPMAPLSVLGALRHEMLRRLDASIDMRPARRVADESPLDALRAEIPLSPAANPRSSHIHPRPILSSLAGGGGVRGAGGAVQSEIVVRSAASGAGVGQLWVLCRSLEQLTAAVHSGVTS